MERKGENDTEVLTELQKMLSQFWLAPSPNCQSLSRFSYIPSPTNFNYMYDLKKTKQFYQDMCKNYFSDLGEGWANSSRVDGEVPFVVPGDSTLSVELKCRRLSALNCNFTKSN